MRHRNRPAERIDGEAEGQKDPAGRTRQYARRGRRHHRHQRETSATAAARIRQTGKKPGQTDSVGQWLR